MSDELRSALQPFAELGGGCAISSTPAYHDLEDDVVVYKSGAGAITAGDVRKARAALAAHADDGEPVKVLAEGYDERYCPWFTCRGCKHDIIHRSAKFCAGCGRKIDWGNHPY